MKKSCYFIVLISKTEPYALDTNQYQKITH